MVMGLWDYKQRTIGKVNWIRLHTYAMKEYRIIGRFGLGVSRGYEDMMIVCVEAS